MRKFVTKILVFVIILTAFGYLFDYIISKGLRESNTITYQSWNDIFKSDMKSNSLIFGGSRACVQYNPIILDSILNLNFYNLGSNGQYIDYQMYRYNTYCRFNIKPKLIIQNVDILTLGICDYEYGKIQFLPFIFDDTLMSLVSKEQKIDYFDRKIPLIRYFGYHKAILDGFKSFFGMNDFLEEKSIKGYFNSNNTWDGAELNKIDTIFYEKNPKAIYIFEKYLEKCKKEGIKVILVSAPLYIQTKRKVFEYAKMNAMYEKIALKYNMKMLDYTNDSICYTTKYFYNGTHLNKKGADIFSRKLANDIKSLNL